MTDAAEPDELDLRMRRSRKRMDTARAELMADVSKAIGEGRGPSRIARYSGYTREYITKLRDRRAKTAQETGERG